MSEFLAYEQISKNRYRERFGLDFEQFEVGQKFKHRPAYRSKGGKTFIAASSTAAHGKVSRIVAKLSGPVTDPRMDVEYIVTEYGVCNLKGKSTTERALALINIAAPAFQQQLLNQAKEMGYVA